MGIITNCLVVLLVSAAVAGKFKSDAELELEQCYSQVDGMIARVSIRTKPTQPVEVLRIGSGIKKFEITCLQIFESGPTLLASQQTLCTTPATYQVCSTRDGLAEPDWSCTDITQYQSHARKHHVLGNFNDDDHTYMIQWTPAIGDVCYPRDLTVQFVGKKLTKKESEVGAVVAFVLIAVLVGVLVIFFLSYQLRKQFKKFWKREMMTARRPDDDNKDDEEMENGGGDGYPDGVDPGTQMTTLDNEVTLFQTPLPQKWYERHDYTGGSPRNRYGRPLQQPQMESIDISPPPQTTQPSAFLPEEHYAGADPQEMNMMCADCRMLIDDTAPQFCPMTGLRHY